MIESPEKLFPPLKWSRADWLWLATLTVFTAALLAVNLSVRTLWGPEGRWALIVREMMVSGNYFYPTTNCIPDFDKPLLSHWLTLPLAFRFGLTELTLRLPGAISGLLTVLVTYLTGRRLIGRRGGGTAALLLATMIMFLFWARTASAEVLNLLGIWSMVFFFLSGAGRGRFPWFLAFYGTGAIASFCKGPVAPAVAFAAAGSYSLAVVFYRFRDLASRGAPWKGEAWTIFREEFRWILSLPALSALLGAAALFSALLLWPVAATGSWQPVQLMITENVTRFFRPFDHKDPVYTYLLHTPVFLVPWTLVALAALWETRRWTMDRRTLWCLFSALGIFVFFTVSGSRRGYYILPVIPALALITGKVLDDWFARGREGSRSLLSCALAVTAAMALVAGMGLLATPLFTARHNHFSQFFAGPFAAALGAGALFMLAKGRRVTTFAVLMAAVISIELWVLGPGTYLAERDRTLKAFCSEVRPHLATADRRQVALFQGATASLIFYLDLGCFRSVNTPAELKSFGLDHPGGLLIMDMGMVRFFSRDDLLKRLRPLAIQKTERDDNEERFALFMFPDADGPAP
jgi:4-amino-4-deoxy-L-arabinose transferase-like glycosyltransferase